MFELMLLTTGFLVGWFFGWQVVRAKLRHRETEISIQNHLLNRYRGQTLARCMLDDAAIKAVEQLRRENAELKRRLENV